MQVRTVAIVVVIIAGVGVYVLTAPKTAGAATTVPTTAATTNTTTTVPATKTAYTSVTKASTSSRGVTATSINVVFPVVSLTSLAGQEGFANDLEFGQQTQAIHLYVNLINQKGGINGRKINPIIVSFNPTDEASMRALCKDWTEGSPPVFAVLDGEGTWTGDNELCVTQEGHTPMIGAWTTVTNWTNMGSPYLWWTGPDDAAILKSVVQWGVSSKLLGGGRKVGILAGDRASDQTSLNDYLLPALKKAGVKPMVITVAADPSETSTTDTETTLAVEKFKQAGVQSLIPLVPENVLFPMLGAQQSQQYYPKLLLSDYESSIQIGLGLIPTPYLKELNGQEGLTTQTLGGVDDPRPESQGGYDPGVRACWTPWHKKYPQTPKGQLSDVIEEQGPIVAWCQAINLFATAAKKAGPNLNRRSFVEAMASIKNYPGTWSPVLSFADGKFFGPTQYQVVKIHYNKPVSKACKLPTNKIPQITCWVPVQGWKPLVSN